MLLAGWDEIDLTLNALDAVEAFERSTPNAGRGWPADRERRFACGRRPGRISYAKILPAIERAARIERSLELLHHRTLCRRPAGREIGPFLQTDAMLGRDAAGERGQRPIDQPVDPPHDRRRRPCG